MIALQLNVVSAWAVKPGLILQFNVVTLLLYIGCFLTNCGKQGIFEHYLTLLNDIICNKTRFCYIQHE